MLYRAKANMVQITSSQIKKWKIWSDLIVVWLTMIGTLAGGGYALIQYLDNSNAERAKETLKFVERFDKDRLYDSRQKIDIALMQMEEGLRKKIKEGEPEYLTYLEAGINEKLISHHLNQLFDFYDQLHACSLANLCDTDISIRFFGKYAYDLVGTIFPYIEKQKTQSGDAQYGSGIKFYFSKYKEQQDKQP